MEAYVPILYPVWASVQRRSEGDQREDFEGNLQAYSADL